MKTKCTTILLILFLLSCCSVAFADREMKRKEILEIFQKLTEQPRKTWISAGTIEATHEEYKAAKTTDKGAVNRRIKKRIKQYQNKTNKRELVQEMQKMKLDAIPFNTRYELSNEYKMTSAVTVKFDGDRFYWEINVDSRTDSVRPGKALEGNFMTDQFDLDWNTKRIFAWDGEKYTTYCLPGNHAIVDAADINPRAVNGPLTAGIIPWGYGYYTYENLSKLDLSGVEKYIGRQTQIHLTLTNPDGSEMLFVMDPAKDYAVLSCSIIKYDHVTSKHYSDYRPIAGNWVPFIILLERYETETDRLLARDLWDITSIDTDIPESYDFEVGYEDDALIQYLSLVTDESAMYRHSDIIDTDQLLAERLEFAANEGLQPQNCATAALKYALGRLGRDVTGRELANLVSGTDKSTTLYQMKQLAQKMGFYCKVVKADISTLRNLGNCEIILHIPGKKHFVAVGDIAGDSIGIVDLADSKFYYRADLNFFSMDWTGGTALIISDSPIEGKFIEIGERELGDIKGAYGYQCNIVRQEPGYVLCETAGNECLGYYRNFWKVWGCGPAGSGSCSQSRMIRYQKSLCTGPAEDCEIDGNWIFHYMSACKSTCY